LLNERNAVLLVLNPISASVAEIGFELSLLDCSSLPLRSKVFRGFSPNTSSYGARIECLH
jgi:hypothetical protein